MRVLVIDSAGPVIGVGLAVGTEARVRVERISRGAETRLVPWARELCAEAGFALAGIDGIAVTTGPGAFTGVRVGLATAIGLAMSLDRPLWCSDSLAPRAARVQAPVVLVMLDARKSRVYAAMYLSGEVRSGPADVAPELALAWASGPFVATGEGALVYRGLVEAAGGVVAPESDDPAVDVLARLGREALRRGAFVDPLSVVPLYLRDADAVPPKEGLLGGRETPQ